MGTLENVYHLGSERKGRVGRADLLCLLDAFPKERHDEAARSLGFRQKEQEADRSGPVGKAAETPVSAGEQPVSHHFVTPKVGAQFWRVVEARTKERQEVLDRAPEWFLNAAIEGEIEPPNRDLTEPALQPLIPWARLWPFLLEALGEEFEGHQVDIPTLVDRLASARPVDRLPRQRRRGWATHCQLILDCDERLLPFWGDLWDLCKKVEDLRGEAGFEVVVFEQGPENLCRNGLRDHEPARAYRLPRAGTPILILSDLGLYSSSGADQRAWRRYGQRLKRHGFSPVVLSPAPPERWDEKLAGCFRLACWDRGQRLPRLDGCNGKAKAGQGHKCVPEADLTTLLALLSVATRIEPHLLRAVRQLLPASRADVSLEAGAWLHRDTINTPLGFVFEPKVLDDYRELFCDLPEELQLAVIDTIRKHHSHLSPYLIDEERLIAAQLMGWEAEEENKRLQRLAKTLARPDSSTFQAFRRWSHWMFFRQDKTMWAGSEAMAAAWAFKNRGVLEKEGEVVLPGGLSMDKVAWVLGVEEREYSFSLTQVGEQLRLRPSSWRNPDQDWQSGSLLGRISSSMGYLEVEFRRKGHESRYCMRLELARETVLSLDEWEEVVLSSEQQTLTLKKEEKLSWAVAMGRDTSGLYALVPEGEGTRRLLWVNPGVREHISGLPVDVHGCFWDEKSYSGGNSVDISWADSVELDEYGLFAEVTIQGVVQRFRWIMPGSFMMGSPEGEPERLDRELQHKVVISQGYWLADTTCTQALWQAVMGENPSHFKGERRPVETVSWDDVQRFLETISKQWPGLELRLPTEAEWEYACRAGTGTPFSFGEQVSTEQVNYNGKHPYNKGPKGEYRGETVEVGALPCNSWGLYEMHGNVWEWCSDRYGDYPAEPDEDPVGPDGGEGRVLRGGSWVGSGGYVRSAYRFGYSPSNRVYDFGFRLARGQKSKSKQE